MEEIEDEQLAKAVSMDTLTNEKKEYWKGYLLSAVVSFEEYNGTDFEDDARDLVLVDTPQEAFILVMDWRTFKELWFGYRKQSRKQNIAFNLIAN